MEERLPVEIIDFEERYKPALEDISLPWLLEYDLLEPVDLELSEKWRRLWKWYIGTFLALFVGFFVALISALLGLLVMLASIIGTIVVSILKLVYLWRTTRTFREYEAA